MKKALFVLWNITLLSCMTILAGSCSPSLTSQVRAMEKVHNLHQLDKELSFYADDARFEIDDGNTVQGKDELRKLFTVDVLFNNSLAFNDISIVGNSVFCTVEEKNDMWRALGVEKVYGRCEIVFKNGLIQEIRGDPNCAQSESRAELYKADEAFSTWADKNRPEEVARLLGGKPFKWITPETALDWLKLAREWKKLERIR